MPQTLLENVVAHWSNLIENFETSAKDFYTTVELGLDARKIPGLKVSRVKWSEGGVLSPDREYLRVEGDRHRFDMCAAPFGTGYFFSSWVTKRRARFVVLQMIALAVLAEAIAVVVPGLLSLLFVVLQRVGLAFGFTTGALIQFGTLPVTVLLVLWLVGIASRAGFVETELAVLTVPVLGWIYARLFAPETYYRIDTLQTFQSAVHAAMMEAIDQLTTAKGVRGLNGDERKPLFLGLV